MFKSFFLNRKWFMWSILGSFIILFTTWYKVQLDVKINEWFGEFYNLIQTALTKPNSVSLPDYFIKLFSFLEIAALFIVVAIFIDFFARHYVFRWRTAMTEYYQENWHKLRHIEGASQRLQEDTMRFASIMENLGVKFIRSILTLIAFLPILVGLSLQITEYPYFGPVSNGLVYLAVFSALFGTVILAIAGIRLPGLEFNNQKVEAAYRKELVHGEDDKKRAEEFTLQALFADVRKNYFRLYFNYLYFDLVKWSYLQTAVIFPYIALGPVIVAGTITLGVMQQIIRAFGKVEESFQFLVYSWGTIVELMSIYKRLKAFESQMK